MYTKQLGLVHIWLHVGYQEIQKLFWSDTSGPDHIPYCPDVTCRLGTVHHCFNDSLSGRYITDISEIGNAVISRLCAYFVRINLWIFSVLSRWNLAVVLALIGTDYVDGVLSNRWEKIFLEEMSLCYRHRLHCLSREITVICTRWDICEIIQLLIKIRSQDCMLYNTSVHR